MPGILQSTPWMSKNAMTHPSYFSVIQYAGDRKMDAENTPRSSYKVYYYIATSLHIKYSLQEFIYSV